MKILKEQLPKDWLEQHKAEFLELAEKLTITNIRLKALELKWEGPFDAPADYLAFYESEAKRLGFTVDEIKSFFHQAAILKAKEQVFDQHYGELVPRSDDGKSLLSLKKLMELVHSAELSA
ncbi:MAG: hypothetical protein QNL04_00555 [SAR324 cluster bacterium]|nr:hypothetical protein [SAR324 cluster bacterium]